MGSYGCRDCKRRESREGGSLRIDESRQEATTGGGGGGRGKEMEAWGSVIWHGRSIGAHQGGLSCKAAYADGGASAGRPPLAPTSTQDSLSILCLLLLSRPSLFPCICIMLIKLQVRPRVWLKRRPRTDPIGLKQQ